MKKGRMVAAMLLGAALIAAGCARPATPAPTPVKAPPVATPSPGVISTPTPAAPVAVAKPTGELRVAIGYVGSEMPDPMAGPHSGTKYVADPLYDFLVGVTPDGKLSTETGLAHKWEMSPDGKKWTFYLRKGIKFHNGDELTAQDVKTSIERVASEKSVATNAGYYRREVERMELPDPYTIVFHLKSPSSLFNLIISALGGSEGMIVAGKYSQQVGDEAFGKKPIGTGPFKFVEQMFGSYIRYEAQDKHWLVGVPQFKTITILAIPESTTRIAGLKRKLVDIGEVERDALSDVKAAGLRIVENAEDAELILWFNQEWDLVPVAKKQVRLALALAINQQELIDHIFAGMGKPGATPRMASFTIGADPTLKPHPYDPERARKLLAEAGYPKGFEIEMYSFTRPGFPENPKAMEAIAGYWQKIGIQPKIIPTDYGAYRAKYRARKTPGAAALMGTATFSWQGLRMGRYADINDEMALFDRPDVFALADKAEAALNLREQEELMRQTFRIAYEDVLWISLGYYSRVFAIGDKVESFSPRMVPFSLSLDTAVRRK